MARLIVCRALIVAMAAAVILAILESPHRTAAQHAGGKPLVQSGVLRTPLLAAQKKGKKNGLAGDYVLSLPRGFYYYVSLKSLGAKRFRFVPKQLVFSGIYTKKGKQLVITNPKNPRLAGFVWTVQQDKSLRLVGEPPKGNVGASYLGATLVPLR